MNDFFSASDPPDLHYNASLYQSDQDNLSLGERRDTKVGPQVIHKYNIKNKGPFEVEEAEIIIMWPYQTLTGKLYCKIYNSYLYLYLLILINLFAG